MILYLHSLSSINFVIRVSIKYNLLNVMAILEISTFSNALSVVEDQGRVLTYKTQLEGAAPMMFLMCLALFKMDNSASPSQDHSIQVSLLA